MGGGRILLAEDDDALAELVAFHVRREGFEVDRARDG
jgi:two-component system, OmpR family, phosphate regulon response regulator PhoB